MGGGGGEGRGERGGVGHEAAWAGRQFCPFCVPADSSGSAQNSQCQAACSEAVNKNPAQRAPEARIVIGVGGCTAAVTNQLIGRPDGPKNRPTAGRAAAAAAAKNAPSAPPGSVSVKLASWQPTTSGGAQKTGLVSQ